MHPTPLHAGQRIEIVETNLKKHKGTFSTVTDEGLQLRETGGDVGIKMENVMRVTQLDKSHRLRNVFVLGAVGAGIGAASRKCSNSSDAFCGLGRSIAAGLGGRSGWAEEQASKPRYRVTRQFIASNTTDLGTFLWLVVSNRRLCLVPVR
jgi:hypothetical protein